MIDCFAKYISGEQTSALTLVIAPGDLHQSALKY